jgi:hypothetical protein
MTDKTIRYTVTADDNPFAAGMRRVSDALSGLRRGTGAAAGDFKAFSQGITAQMERQRGQCRDRR